MHFSDYIKALDHHAYFIHAFKDGAQKLKEHLKRAFGISHTQNPDFYHEKFEVIGIDDSRKLKELHSSKSFKEGTNRIFIIESSSITHEAQNALLKIFEEPNTDTHFFLIMPSVEVLLPTLRSRLSIIKTEQENPLLESAENFLKLSAKQKIEFVDEIAERIADEKTTKSEALEFLASLEIVLYKKGIDKNTQVLKAILKARDYLNDRSASVKQLLEFVALSC
jgi:DNA polymerase III delta prime subunit